MKPQLTPTLDEFSQLAKRGNVIPLFTEFIADGETPVSAFKKLGNPGYSFLFESTEKNDVSGRFSFVGVEPRVIIQSYGREIQVIDRDTEKRFDTATDPLDEIRKLMARYQFVSRPELPRFAGGAADFPFIPSAECELPPARSNFRCEEFERAVRQAKEYICAGDIFQVVLSQRFESDFVGEPLDFYRCLRFINPSPYMFCLKLGEDF